MDENSSKDKPGSMDQIFHEENDFKNATELNLNVKEGVNTAKSNTTPAPKIKPDKNMLTEMFKNTMQAEKMKAKEKRGMYTNYILVIIAVLLGGVILWQLSLQSQISQIKQSINLVPVDAEDPAKVAPTSVKSIKVFSPEEFSEVSGLIGASVEVEGISNLTFKVYDDNGIEMGGKSLNTSESLTQKKVFAQDVLVTSSPTVSSGYLIIYPTDENLNSQFAESISLTFPRTITIDRITLIGPIRDQLINSNQLRFVGEMKNFQGGKVGFILKNNLGFEIYKNEFTSTTFRSANETTEFDQIVEIGTLPRDLTETGTLEIYDPSNPLGTSVLTIPVRFQ
jgi:hypothetical protein